MTKIKRTSNHEVGLSAPIGNDVSDNEFILFQEIGEKIKDIEDKLNSFNVEVIVDYDDTEIKKDLKSLKYSVDYYIETLWRMGFRPLVVFRIHLI